MTKSLVILFASPILVNLAGAAAIANWKEFNPNAAVVPISGANTDSPVFGDGTTNSAQAAWIGGQFGTTGSPESATLAVGDTLTISGGLTLTGGTNNNSQFRFGVFNDGGQFAADSGLDWTGGWLHVIGSNSDVFRARTGATGAFISTGGNAEALATMATRSGSFDGDSTAPFTFSMSITRSSDTTVDINSTFIGGDGNYSELLTEDNVATSDFTYTAAGLLFGGSSGVEEASFSNVQFEVSSVPEPSSVLLCLAGALLGCSRRR